MKLNKSLFITIEGGEGAGKTTLIDAITAALKLQGIDFVRTREPGGSPLGEEIRSLLLQKGQVAIGERAELLLFLASRAQHVAELIQPALLSGKIVICDRFNDSTIAYQGFARGLGAEEIQHLCDFSTNHLQPDLTLYLDLDPEMGRQRITKAVERAGEVDRIESETLKFHQLVRKGFLQLAENFPQRIHLIDAGQAPDKVFDDAWTLLVNLTQRSKDAKAQRIE